MAQIYESSKKMLPISILICLFIQIIGLYDTISTHDSVFNRRVINYITVYLIILLFAIGTYVGCRKKGGIFLFFMIMMFLFFMTQYYTSRGERFVDFFDKLADRLRDPTNQSWDQNMIVEQSINFLATIALILSTFAITLIGSVLITAYIIFNLSDESYANFISGSSDSGGKIFFCWIIGLIFFILIYLKARRKSFRVAVMFSICFISNLCAYSYAIDEGHVWDQRYKRETFESLSDFETFSGIPSDFFPYLIASAFVFAFMQTIGGYYFREKEDYEEPGSIFGSE